jgi:hypothetical protein
MKPLQLRRLLRKSLMLELDLPANLKNLHKALLAETHLQIKETKFQSISNNLLFIIKVRLKRNLRLNKMEDNKLKQMLRMKISNQTWIRKSRRREQTLVKILFETWSLSLILKCLMIKMYMLRLDLIALLI